MKQYRILRLSVFCIIIGLVVSCEKFVEIPPSPSQIMSYKVFENDATATKAIIGIYIQMIANNNQFTSGNTTYYSGLSSDELYFYTNDLKQEFLKNDISASNHDFLSIVFWTPAYKYIYTANACLEGLENSKNLTPATKRILTGEAKFIRAYCYFYLANLFGDVPLVTTTNYNDNSLLARTPQIQIYNQIVSDLTDAQNLMDAAYPTTERVRPNKWAASALLARAYLYKGEWQKAEQESANIISSGAYSLQANLNNVFLKGSTETIFQIQPGVSNINSWEGNIIIPASATTTPTYLLTTSILNSFEAGDLRRASWVQSRTFAGQTLYYPFKYKVKTSATITEYNVYLRLAEQYLIRAEAMAQQGNITGAKSDINTIRNRAGLSNTNANDKASLLLAVEKERQTELFAEWGHRWFDLKRTNRVNTVIGGLKPTTWQPTDALWPIPTIQLNLNPALSQNPGY